MRKLLWFIAILCALFLTELALISTANAQIVPAQNQITQGPFGGLVYSTSTTGTKKLAQLFGTAFGQLAFWNGTTWTTMATSSIGLVTGPGGSDRQVQFNNAGSFGGSANFTFSGSQVSIFDTAPLKLGLFANQAIFDTSGISSSDKTFSFPNQSGTFCLVLSACDGLGTSTEPFMAKYFVATSTLVPSRFPLVSSTAITATNFFGALTGNADTATKLATPRAINGVNFDGSAAITITAASSSLLGDNNTFSGIVIFSKILNLSATSSSLLSTDSAGNVVATTSVGTNYLKGIPSSILAFNASGAAIATTSIGTNYLIAPANSILAGNASGAIIASTTIGWNLLKGPASSIFAFDASGNPIATSSIGTNYLIAPANSLLAGNATGAIIASSTIGWNLLKGPVSSIFAFDGSGNPLATTSIGVNYLTGTLPVVNGGTGAATLTGCLTGNGTSAITGSGTCNTSSATVTSITGGIGLNGGTITTSGTLNLKSYTATSTADTSTQVLFFTSTNATPATFGGDNGLVYTTTGDKLTATNASTTNFSAATTFYTPFASGVVITDANKLTSAAGATTCSNAFVRAMSGAYAATCNQISLTADVTGTLGVTNGGTGAATFGQGWIFSPLAGGTGALAASTSPTVNYITATSTAATSTLPNLSVLTNFLLPNSTAQTPGVAGQTAIDTTDDQLKYFGAAAEVLSPFRDPSFTIFATSTAFVGTTTWPLGPDMFAETWKFVRCYTDVGTINVVFSDGSNNMNQLNASTTVGKFSLTTNNSFSVAEKRQVTVGNPASSPTYLSCTISKTIDPT